MAAATALVVPTTMAVDGRVQVLGNCVPDRAVGLESSALKRPQRKHRVLGDRVVDTAALHRVGGPDALVTPHAILVHAGDESLVQRLQNDPVARRIEFAQCHGEEREVVGLATARGEGGERNPPSRPHLDKTRLHRLLDRGMALGVPGRAQSQNGEGRCSRSPVILTIRIPATPSILEQVHAQIARATHDSRGKCTDRKRVIDGRLVAV